MLQLQLQILCPESWRNLLKMSGGQTVRWRSAEVGLASRRKANNARPMPADQQTLQLEANPQQMGSFLTGCEKVLQTDEPALHRRISI